MFGSVARSLRSILELGLGKCSQIAECLPDNDKQEALGSFVVTKEKRGRRGEK